MSRDFRKPNWLQAADELAGIDQPPARDNLLSECKDLLFLITQKAPGYDWNADQLYLTLKVGDLCQKIDAVNTLPAQKDMSSGTLGQSTKRNATIKSDVPNVDCGQFGSEKRFLDEVMMAFVRIGRDMSVPMDVRDFATQWRDKTAAQRDLYQ